MSDLLDQELDQTLFDRRVQNNVVLKLAVLHVFNQWQVELWHVVLVHVEEDVSDHDDVLFDLLPDAIELSQKLLVMLHLDVFSNGLQKLNRGVLDAIVQHLTMLVEHQAISRAVQLLIRQAARLLVVDLEDGILNGLPVLDCLRSLHVCVTHLVSVNQKLVRWQIRHFSVRLTIISSGFLKLCD